MHHRHEYLNKRQVLHRDDLAAVLSAWMQVGGSVVRLCADRWWLHRGAWLWSYSIDARVVFASFSCTKLIYLERRWNVLILHD